MDQIHSIRQMYYEQGLDNISEIARRTGLDWKTVQKYVDKTDFNEANPIPEEKEPCPKLDQYKELINKWLKEDRDAPRKQRHTARRVYDRLSREAEGFDCSYRLVAEYVSVKKEEFNLKKKNGYIPLVHPPGNAQADFGAADFYEKGVRHSGKYFVLDFPYSNCGYIQLNYGENSECLLEGMTAIFEHVEGVPREIWFDNATSIVKKVIRGGGREVSEKFMRFAEHYGFKAVFMNPYSGNEKGGVEAKVGYTRRNMLVPVPRFIQLEDYNSILLSECDKDAEREHYRHPEQTIMERFKEDKSALRGLPGKPFDTASYKCVRTDKWGKFTLDEGKHIYSSSPGHAESSVWVKLTSGTVEVMDGKQKKIVTHKRLYGDNMCESMEWLPYLEYIAKKPRSLRNSGIYDMMPEKMRVYMDGCGNSERGKVLKALSHLTDLNGFDSALQTVGQAIRYQANDAESLINLYRRLYSDVPELPPVNIGGGVPDTRTFDSGISEYDSLLERRPE